MINKQTYSRRIIYSIILAYFAYALLFIWNTSYVIDGQRYFSLLDDAMISMRYAANYAAGNGPYFNADGANVEGYTNPLWMLTMAGVHLLPLAKQYTSLIIQLLAAILMSINLLFVTKLADLVSKGNKNIVYASVLMTAFFLPLNVWALGGMEVAALVPITTATAYYLFISIKKQEYSHLIILLPAIGVLLRPDYLLLMLVFYFTATSFIDKRNKKFDNLFFVSIFAVIFLLLFFRLYYYEGFLPNTYYLKMTAYPLHLRIIRGFFSFISLGYIWIWLFLFWLYTDKKANYYSYIFLFIIPAIIIVYNIYIGGDAWDWWNGSNRFISIVIPIIFIIFADIEFEHYYKYNILNPQKPQKVKQNSILLILGTLLLINTPIIFKSWEELLLLKPPVLMQDNRKHTLLALEAERLLPDDATVALATAGVIPYYLNRKIIDILGKNDNRIAGIQGRIEKGFAKYNDYKPGHNKWDYSYSIGHLQPDAVVQLWTHHAEALPYLSRNYKLINAGHFHFFIKVKKNH